MSLYKRGGQYWYKFRWTIKVKDGLSENYLIRKSARTANRKRAGEVEDEHRRALILGLTQPTDVWPKAEPEGVKVPTLRVFGEQFVEYVRVHKKAGTVRFYRIAKDRMLKFSPLADALLSDITGELVSKYVNWRRSTASSESILTVNGDLRTLRRMLKLAREWGLIQQTPTIHELPGGKGRERVISFAEEISYLSKASQTARDAALLAVDTGMRPNSELMPLKWSNVHLECTQDAPQGFVHVAEGKTDSAVRNIPLTPRTREMLLARRQLFVGPKDAKRPCGEFLYVFPGDGDSGHVVTLQHAHE